MLGSAIVMTMPLENMMVNLMRHLDMLTVSGEVHGMKQQARIISLYVRLLSSSRSCQESTLKQQTKPGFQQPVCFCSRLTCFAEAH